MENFPSSNSNFLNSSDELRKLEFDEGKFLWRKFANGKLPQNKIMFTIISALPVTQVTVVNVQPAR